MPIDWSVFTFAKGSRKVDAIKRERRMSAQERLVRAKVRERDQGRCFFPNCRMPTSDPHHIVLRSQGGQWTTANVVSACRKHHSWCHSGLITVTGNPDRGPVNVTITTLGREAKVRVPLRSER